LAIEDGGVWRGGGFEPVRLDRAEIARRLAAADLDLAAVDQLASAFEAGCFLGQAGEPFDGEEEA